MFSVFQTCCNLAVAFFSLNLGTFNAADAGGNAGPADSSTSVPTESCTCCTLSSVYCLRLYACTHMQPDEYAAAIQLHAHKLRAHTNTRTHACAPHSYQGKAMGCVISARSVFKWENGVSSPEDFHTLTISKIAPGWEAIYPPRYWF